MVLKKNFYLYAEDWNYTPISHPVQNQLKMDQRSECKICSVETTTGKDKENSRIYRDWRLFSA
jgi:hypothetical protein